MRVLYIDIDTLRADHLGCYGYHRDTSPAIDAIAREGLRLERCYASDTPCLPSRSALTTGRFGIRTGAINHGGVAAELLPEGPGRGFRARLNEESWASCMRRAGFRTASISTFGERHSSLHWYAGYNEVINIGEGGMEQAHDVLPEALAWLDRRGRDDRWFLHLHLWDPHTPYRAPAAYGEPFARAPLPAWYTEEVRAAHWRSYGPHSAREVTGFTSNPADTRFPRQPQQIATMADARRMFDGHDTGIRYADDHIARVVARLRELGVWEDTAVIISSDHGETLGELNIYGDHQTADEHTHRVPFIMRWPGERSCAPGTSDRGLHYQVDAAATILELMGGSVPSGWDGRSFLKPLRASQPTGRDHLVLSQAAWTCQRAVRWDDWLCIRTYHDGYHPFPELMLFDVARDPHETTDLARQRPELVQLALARLDAWHAQMLRSSPHADPMGTVLREGGPFHVRGQLDAYRERLRETGRSAAAGALGSIATARAAAG